jgi:hypothetical protein
MKSGMLVHTSLRKKISKTLKEEGLRILSMTRELFWYPKKSGVTSLRQCVNTGT